MIKTWTKYSKINYVNHQKNCTDSGDRQGWARDVKSSRPRRDVCSSRDVIETLKYKFSRLQ